MKVIDELERSFVQLTHNVGDAYFAMTLIKRYNSTNTLKAERAYVAIYKHIETLRKHLREARGMINHDEELKE